MADKTRISWTDATWNPVTGCTRVSAGCERCYIDWAPPFRIAGRHFTDANGERSNKIGSTTGVLLHFDRLDQPLRWKRGRKIFVNSLSDLFHDEVPDDFIARTFAVMAMAPQHTFQLLTKRPARMRSLLSSPGFVAQVNDWTGSSGPETDIEWPLRNVWVGVTVENQAAADLRVELLLRTPAAARFLSCEPLIGPVDLTPILRQIRIDRVDWAFEMDIFRPGTMPAGIDWVIVGGESGSDARPMASDWARSLRDQCVSAGNGIPFWFKQWGDRSKWVDSQGDIWTYGADGLMHTPETAPFPREYVVKKWGPLRPINKAAAGNQLDGQVWEQFPDVTPPARHLTEGGQS